MSKKRRMFDIDLPEESAGAVPAPALPEPPQRRGPMATAIGETATTLRERAGIEAEIRAENDALAHEFVRLKKLGLITDMIPLSAIRSGKLVRDRSQRLDPEVGDLKLSIQAVGLSNPIRVEALGAGVFELVEGWRRLTAYQQLLQETGDARWSCIPAGLVPAGETVEGLYRRMVDENLIRKDISWTEMARLALAYVVDRVGGCDDIDHAVNRLFASANPQKRSYIRRFAFLIGRLDQHLDHPEAIPRALGLSVAHRLEGDPAAATALVNRLAQLPQRSAEQELALLRAFAESAPVISPQGNPARGRPAKRGKTTLRLPLPVGEVKCTASAGKVELHQDRDFSTVDRDRLEAAVEAFFAALG